MRTNKTKPKIVLFNPHQEPGNRNTNQRQPLNILSIAALPLQSGYEVVIIDASVMPDYRERVFKECEDALCFGTTSIIGYQVYHSAVMAREVKERFPSLPIVAGGWYPSVEPEMFIDQGGADIVVRRQGEITFLELLEALRSGSSLEDIEGLVFRNGNEIVHTGSREVEDLNEMPAMPYHLINFEDYFASDPCNWLKRLYTFQTGKDFSSFEVRSLNYVSSFGCPDNCAFCTSPKLLGRKWTALEAERMVDEIDHLVKRHHINHLQFWDANWAVSEKRVFDFCEGILKKGINLNWAAPAESHIINKFDDEVIELMAKSGCYHLFLGSETASSATMKLIKKNIKPGDTLISCERCCNVGIMPTTSYIVGFPGESKESIQATLEEGCEVSDRWPLAEVSLLVFVPLPASEFWEKSLEMGYKPARTLDYWKDYTHIKTEIGLTLGFTKSKNNDETHHLCQPEVISSITAKQIKTFLRCQKYYFWYGTERLKQNRRLNIFESFLNKASRFRLKHKLLGFPIEYKLVNLLYSMLATLKRKRVG